MKHYLLAALAIGLLQSCVTPKPSDSPSDRMAKVENSLINPVFLVGDSTWNLKDRMVKYGVPGVSIAVINNGKIDWVKSYGVMDKETGDSVTGQTLFQAGSISKPVAAYGALKAVESGKIDLDQDVNSYLTSWKLPENEFTKAKKVTLRHLLSHTGGVTVHGFPGYSTDQPLPTLVQVLDGSPPANTAPIRVDKMPGESFRYSGGGYTIMQQMLIDVYGKPFPSILQELVLQPLAMNASTYDQPLNATMVKLAATGYLPDGTMTKGKRHTYPEMAAAGLWTTAEDLAKFAVDVQESAKGGTGKVLSNGMTKEMITPFVSDFYGLGLGVEKHGDEIYFGHGGWDEGFSSELVAHRDKGYGVVILTNANQPEFISELIRAVALTYSWSNYVPTYSIMEMDSAKLSALTGRYRNNSDGLIIIFNKGNRLFRKYLRGEPAELFKVSDSTYVSRKSDQLVQFKNNPANGQLNILFPADRGKPLEFIHPRMSDNETVPYEYLLAGNFDKALEGYRTLMKSNPKDQAIGEDNLNRSGYDLLGSGKTKLAVDVFRVNTLLYPKSANVYDSYAEACLKNGDTTLAVVNYRKSLALNPRNSNATTVLKELLTRK